MPAPPWSSNDYLPRSEIRGYTAGNLRAAFAPDTGVLELLNLERGLGFYWLRDARHLPDHFRAAPLMTILHWWLGSRGQQFVHAAAVGTRLGGVLLAGRGGSGKSTTALACLAAGLSYASDDYCLVAARPAPCVWSLYCSGKLDAESLRRLPCFSSCIDNPERNPGEKAVLMLHGAFPERIITGFPLRAVLLPRVTGRKDTILRSTSPAEGLTALAASTIFQLCGAGQDAFQRMAELLRLVPCYRLELGTEVSQVQQAILQLVAGKGARNSNPLPH